MRDEEGEIERDIRSHLRFDFCTEAEVVDYRCHFCRFVE